MKVFVQGEGDVSLTQANFVAEGGEGKVFAVGGTGYKLYHDPAKAIPAGKVQELAEIRDGDVIRPDKLVFKSGRAREHVGHTFRFVKDTWVLCQLFPRSFREREGLTHDTAVNLVRRMQVGVEEIHRAGVLIVDLNEMNFLVSRDFSAVYFIDVDSYQTTHFPATAIMPSVRDWRTPLGDFTEMSDWFSFAIVSFQLLVGIHPYKGKHPTVHGLEERMKGGISVFCPDVSVPKVCYPLDVIPQGYRDWYRAVLEDGKRVPPPADVHGTIVVRPVVRAVVSSDGIEIHEIAEWGEDVRRVVYVGARIAVHAGSTVYVDGRRAADGFGPVVFGGTPRNGHVIVASRRDGMLALWDATAGVALDVTLRCDELAAHDGRIYVRCDDKVHEIEFVEAANRVLASARLAANVLQHASRLYDGVVVQSLLGEPHATLFPRPGASYQVSVPEIKGHKVVQAKLEGRVLMVAAARGGSYRRFVFRFDQDFASYDVREVEGSGDLNFVTLDSGICVCVDDERIEVFSARMGSASVKVVEDPVVGDDMRLVKDGSRVLFHRGRKLYSMRMR